MPNDLIMPDAEKHYSRLIPASATDETEYRIHRYFQYLDDTGVSWLVPDLQAYGEWLQTNWNMGNLSINHYLGTLRTQYRRLARDNNFRRMLLAQYHRDLVEEWRIQLENALHPSQTDFKVHKVQDENKRLRMTNPQVKMFLSRKTGDPLTDARDDAIKRLLLATGMREFELVALTIDDIMAKWQGVRSVHILQGKGDKERFVPIEDYLPFFMPSFKLWQKMSLIQSGVAFPRLYKGGRVGDTPMNARSIEYILTRYTIEIDGEETVVKPHDVRATYARSAYLAGNPIIAIAKNMGHDSTKTTEGYIGDLDVDARNFKPFYGDV